MSIESGINLGLAIVTALAAVLALFFSGFQIHKSNQQALLDRRMNACLKLQSLLSLCEEHRSVAKQLLSDGERGPVFSTDLFFLFMTNNTFLEEIQPAIKHALDSEWQRKYLLKMEEIKCLSQEVDLIFPRKPGGVLAFFLCSYQEMLVSLYKYQVLLNDLSKDSENDKRPFPTDDPFEVRCRKNWENTIKKTFDQCDQIFRTGALEKARRKTRL